MQDEPQIEDVAVEVEPSTGSEPKEQPERERIRETIKRVRAGESATEDAGKDKAKQPLEEGLASEGKEEAPKGEAKEEKPKAEEAKGEPKQEEIKPPNSWKKDAKEAFEKLPPDLKAVVSQREKERDNAVFEAQRTASKAQKTLEKYETELKEVQKVESRVIDIAKELQTTPRQVINNVLDRMERINRNPVEGIIEIADHYKIDLVALVNGRKDLAYDQEIHDYDLALSQERARARRLEEQMQLVQQRAQEQEAQAENQRLNTLFKAWYESLDSDALEESRAVDPDIFDMYVDAFAQKYPNTPVSTILTQALEAAVAANPELRQARYDRLTAQQRAIEAQRVAEAKRKGGLTHSSLSPTPPGANGRSPNENDRDRIRSIVKSFRR